MNITCENVFINLIEAQVAFEVIFHRYSYNVFNMVRAQRLVIN